MLLVVSDLLARHQAKANAQPIEYTYNITLYTIRHYFNTFTVFFVLILKTTETVLKITYTQNNNLHVLVA